MIQKPLTQLSKDVEIPNFGSDSVKEDEIDTKETAVEINTEDTFSHRRWFKNQSKLAEKARGIVNI